MHGRLQVLCCGIYVHLLHVLCSYCIWVALMNITIPRMLDIYIHKIAALCNSNYVCVWFINEMFSWHVVTSVLNTVLLFLYAKTEWSHIPIHIYKMHITQNIANAKGVRVNEYYIVYRLKRFTASSSGTSSDVSASHFGFKPALGNLWASRHWLT